MVSLKKIYLISLGLLGVLLATTVYFIPSENTKYKELTRSELIKLDKGWVVQLDLNNPDQSEKKCNISVGVDGTESDVQDAQIDPEANFRYSYETAPGEGKTVSFKVYGDNGGADHWVQEFHQKI